MFRHGMFRRSLSETMALPLSTVVRVLRERRVVEKLPLAWRTAVRPGPDAQMRAGVGPV